MSIADILNLTRYVVKTDLPNGSHIYSGVMRFWAARRELRARRNAYWWGHNRMERLSSPSQVGAK